MRKFPSSQAVTISVWILPASTPKAYLVKNALDRQAWIPVSQVKNKKPIPGKEGKFQIDIPDWLMNKIEWQ